MRKISVAFLCFESTEDVKHNVSCVSNLVQQASQERAQWVFLPEMWSHQTSSLEDFRKASVIADDYVLEEMQRLAKTYQITLFAGSWTEKSAQVKDKFFNTQYVIGPDGEIMGKYQKIYLFKMDDGSSDPYRETKKFIPGSEPVTCEVDSCKIGLSTCFDVRFPELYLKLSCQAPLDVITLPSAFLRSTGKSHWEVLLRARAIENQSFVIASNRIGPHPDPRIGSYFGHSMVVDPWGKVLLDTQDQKGVCMTTIDLDEVKRIRTLLPLHQVKIHKKSIYDK